MIELLEKPVEAMRRLAQDADDTIVRVMLRRAGQHLAGQHHAGQEELNPVDPDDLSAVVEGLAPAERTVLVSDAEVAAAFRRFS